MSQNVQQICTASVLYRISILKQMQYRFAVNFGTLSIRHGFVYVGYYWDSKTELCLPNRLNVLREMDTSLCYGMRHGFGYVVGYI